MHEIVARLHTVAMTTMLFTRLVRSAISAIGSAPSATVTETTETRPPSCLSESPHSVLMYGNSEMMTWRSMKSTSISANVMANANQAARRPTR